MNHYTRVKICGITRPEDGRHAAMAGADAIGLVFHERSPRHITVAQAREICRQLPAFVTTVALFQDAAADAVQAILQQVPVDCLQFHGSESAEFCRGFDRPYIKALAMGAGDDNTPVQRLAEQYHDARGLILDSHAPGEDGGTGRRFDWSMIPNNLPAPLILAGGLSSNNVAEAIATVKPWAVDVSSGVENEPGVKSADKVTAFIRRVRER